MVSFTDASVARYVFGAPSAAEYQIRNTGFVWVDDTGTPVSYEQWVTPTSAASNYEVVATLVSGSLSSGTVGTPLPLSVDRSWRCSQIGVGIRTATLTMRAYRVGDATVLDTWTVELYAEVQ